MNYTTHNNMKVKIMSTKSRNYFLDNYKALLILLVVTGHFIVPLPHQQCFSGSAEMDYLFLPYACLYFYLRLLFQDMGFEKLIQKLVIPYFVYEFLYYFLYVFIIHKETGLYLNRPKFSLWISWLCFSGES